MLTAAFFILLSPIHEVSSQGQLCRETLEAFIKETPQQIMAEKDVWIPRLEKDCPHLPATLLGAKAKSLEPCDSQNPSAACLDVVQTWQSGARSYLELRQTMDGLPEWARPYWESLQSWIHYFKSFFGQ
jgi:hypothetical protein